MLNKCQFIGNLGKDVEVRSTQAGKEIASLSLGVTEKWKDHSGERKERTEWVRVTIFNEGLVKVAKTYLKKGDRIFIEGQMQTRKWEDKDGQEKYSTEIVLPAFGGTLLMLSPPKEGEARPQQSPPKQSAMLDDLDEIPFAWLLAVGTSAAMFAMQLLPSIAA